MFKKTVSPSNKKQKIQLLAPDDKKDDLEEDISHQQSAELDSNVVVSVHDRLVVTGEYLEIENPSDDEKEALKDVSEDDHCIALEWHVAAMNAAVEAANCQDGDEPVIPIPK